MSTVQYVTDESGVPVAVQIPIKDWNLIKAELESYDEDSEAAEILADTEFLASMMRGRDQAKRRVGKPLSKVII